MRTMSIALLLLLCQPCALSAQPPSVEDAMRALRDAHGATSRERALEQAAIRMLAAADADPRHPAVNIGLANAAHAFAGVDRWETAEALWRRAVAEGLPQLAEGPPDDLVPMLETALADALVQLARRAALRGDWAEAAARYGSVCDAARFERSRAVGMDERILAALDGAAEAFERRGDLVRAAHYLSRAADHPLGRAHATERRAHAAALLRRVSPD